MEKIKCAITLRATCAQHDSVQNEWKALVLRATEDGFVVQTNPIIAERTLCDDYGIT